MFTWNIAAFKLAKQFKGSDTSDLIVQMLKFAWNCRNRFTFTHQAKDEGKGRGDFMFY